MAMQLAWSSRRSAYVVIRDERMPPADAAEVARWEMRLPPGDPAADWLYVVRRQQWRLVRVADLNEAIVPVTTGLAAPRRRRRSLFKAPRA